MASKKFSNDPADEMPSQSEEASNWVSGGKSTTPKPDKPKKEPKKQKPARMKPQPILLEPKHVEMLDQLSKKTMIAKQKIMRSLLVPELEKMYKDKIDS